MRNVILLGILGLTATLSAQGLQYPTTKTVDHVDT